MERRLVPADLEIALAAGQLMAASADVLRRLGRDPAETRLPLTLDSATPALGVLRRAHVMRIAHARAGAGAGDDDHGQGNSLGPLVFWSPAGVVTLNCAWLQGASGTSGVVALRLLDAEPIGTGEAVVVGETSAARPGTTSGATAAHRPDTLRGPNAAHGSKEADGPATAHGPEEADGLLGPNPPGDLGHLAHELRTPLAAIQSLADAMLGGHLGDVESRRNVAYLASIRDTARHALAVVDAMAGREPAAETQLEHMPIGVPVAEAAREVADGFAALAARAGVSLTVSCPTGLAIAGNATDVRQMLINLVSNAIAHGGPGTEVAVTGVADGVGFVAVDVTDTGRGIPRAVIDRLEAGLAVVAERGGSDADRVRLGLSLTKSLAENNGGRLDIQSRPGQTVARLVLPASG